MRGAGLALAAAAALCPALSGQDPPATQDPPTTQDPPDTRTELEKLRAELEVMLRRLEELEGQEQQEAPAAQTGDPPTEQIPPQQEVGPRVPGTGPNPRLPSSGFTIETEDWTFKFGGWVKVDFIHDLDGIGTPDVFATFAIPTGDPPGADDNRTTINADTTRLNFAAERETGWGDFFSFIEGDFRGEASSNFRLRHAYGKLGHLLAGQTWTTFMDQQAEIETLDFEGPNGAIFLRQGQVRWTQPLTDQLGWAIAFEEPVSTFTDPTGGLALGEDPAPDLATHLLQQGENYHVQLSGVARYLDAPETAGFGDDTTYGWGVDFIAQLGTFGRDFIGTRLLYGEGIGRYIQDVTGRGFDGAADANGDLEAVPLWGTGIYGTHWWSENVRSTAVWSFIDVDNTAGQPNDAYKKTNYLSANLVWSPEPWVDIGVEALYGTREDKDGQDGDATRVQFSLKWRF